MAMSLPSKKRSLSDLESLPPIEMESPKPLESPNPKLRKDSAAGESVASDDTAAMALRALSALDGHFQIGRHPLKKRKASHDCWEDDQALGLAPMQSNEEDKATPPKSNTEGSRRGSDAAVSNTSFTALDHLEVLGDDAEALTFEQKEKKVAKSKSENIVVGDEESSQSGTLASSNQRVLIEALISSSSTGGGGSYRRDRLESWGAMSDLSAAGLGSDGRIDAATALAASALHYTGLYEDLTAAANSDTASLPSQSSLGNPNAVPSRISVTGDRKNSAGSELSLFNLHFDGSQLITPSMQAFMDAAMATVGDQLAEIAGAAEMAASGVDIESISSDYLRNEACVDSDVSSTMSPLIGPISDLGGRPRASSTSSKPLSVDYDAVAAAVDAAQAATGALDLTTFAGMAAPEPVPSTVTSNKNAAGSVKNQTPKPTAYSLDEIPLPKSTLNERDMDAIRERARAAAGYVPPSGDSPATPAPRPPVKKRPKLPTPLSDARYLAPPPTATKIRTVSVARPDLPTSTPKISNASRQLASPPATPYPPITQSAQWSTSAKASSQKWDDMFELLVQFVKDRKAEALKENPDKDAKEWEWDGNVPTSYKTKDGKALGRWVNNQRSAKTKGNLKKDREEKLISTGLKWSILVTNSWDDMINELRIYVKQKTKNGEEWDGNVPTNYSIKAKSGDPDDEKNLGRWINRQRSLYHSGKLRKDREKELEDIGLKWSILSITPWDAMYDTLLQYVTERKAANHNTWDGNVPANHKTNDNPPRALGRWINRQRSAYGKGKLKQEYVDKLNELGLRWSIHERKGIASSTSPDEALQTV